jgi:hypothetical protein
MGAGGKRLRKGNAAQALVFRGQISNLPRYVAKRSALWSKVLPDGPNLHRAAEHDGQARSEEAEGREPCSVSGGLPTKEIPHGFT